MFIAIPKALKRRHSRCRANLAWGKAIIAHPEPRGAGSAVWHAVAWRGYLRSLPVLLLVFGLTCDCALLLHPRDGALSEALLLASLQLAIWCQWQVLDRGQAVLVLLAVACCLPLCLEGLAWQMSAKAS